jgi:poly(ribitol-phosphate) beta-N-acetylglucosaminyltransferase
VDVNKRVPDVTVVIAVYNTMPYLTACLESVFGQSIGVERLEVVAVDDGSTDDSGAELLRWAERYPDSMTVLTQANSGGPAGPSNRALDVATGRFVFFLGADDYLGLEALQRLVDTADELSADIVLGRLVGTGGRNVNQAVYKGGNRDHITLADSPLPWALSNTKLFRRELIEEHAIRYPEQLRSGSDQPFTIRAIAVSRVIAVRADYEFYYATRRTDSSNITYRTSLADFVQDTALIMDTVAEVVTDPVAREKVLRRHFTWELGKLLGERFLAATPEERGQVQQGIRKLADLYLTEPIRASLDVQHRVALGITQAGTVDDMVELAEHRRDHGLTPIEVHDGHYYVAYPGFRDARGFPDVWYECTAQMLKRETQTEPARLSWGRSPDGHRALLITWRTSLPDLGAVDGHTRCVSLSKREPVEVRTEDAAEGSVVRTALIPAVLAAGGRKWRGRITFTRSVRDVKNSYAVTAEDVAGVSDRVHREGRTFYRVGVILDDQGEIVVTIQPTSVPRLAKETLRHAVRRVGVRA